MVALQTSKAIPLENPPSDSVHQGKHDNSPALIHALKPVQAHEPKEIPGPVKDLSNPILNGPDKSVDNGNQHQDHIHPPRDHIKVIKHPIQWKFIYTEPDKASKIIEEMENLARDDNFLPSMIQEIQKMLKSTSPQDTYFPRWMSNNVGPIEKKLKTYEQHRQLSRKSSSEIEFENYVFGRIEKLSSRVSVAEGAIECLFWVLILILTTVVIYACLLVCLVSIKRPTHKVPKVKSTTGDIKREKSLPITV